MGIQGVLVLESAKNKLYAKDKKAGIILRQKNPQLQTALFKNILGLLKGKYGSEILKQREEQLHDLFPEVDVIESEKFQMVIKDVKLLRIRMYIIVKM